jgi:hypothetical protein
MVGIWLVLPLQACVKMKSSSRATVVTRAGTTWHVAVACLVCACRASEPPASEPPPPLSDARKGDPLWHGAFHYVPQVQNAATIFDSLQPYAPIAVAGAFLVCRMNVKRNLDTTDWASRPDLKMSLAIGGRPSSFGKGSDNSWESTVSFVDVNLVLGDRVEVSVWDDDMWSGDDKVGTLRTTFGGSFPLTLQSSAFSVECRAMQPHDLALRVALIAHEADPVQDMLEATPLPRFLDASLDLPKKQVAAARKAITNAATFVGWSHREVATRVARQQRIENDWTTKVRAHLNAIVDALPKQGVAVPLPEAGARASGELDCDPRSVQHVLAQHPDEFRDGADCLLHLELTPELDRTLQVDRTFIVSARAIARDGKTFKTREAFAELNGRAVDVTKATVDDRNRLTFGETVRHDDRLRITFGVEHAHDAPLPPVLPEVAAVRVHETAPVLIRVR